MDNDKLIAECKDDGQKWAEAFQKIVINKNITIDHDLMFGWFANIIERSHDYRTRPKKGDTASNIEELEQLTETQCADGNWNNSSYMRGMANGMILSVAIMKGEDPEYLDAPKNETE